MADCESLCLWLNLNPYLNLNQLKDTLYKILYNTLFNIKNVIIINYNNVSNNEINKIEKIIKDKNEKINIEIIKSSKFEDNFRNEIISKIKEEYTIILNEFFEYTDSLKNIEWGKEVYYVKCKFQNFEFFEPFIFKKGSKFQVKDGKWNYFGDELSINLLEDKTYFTKHITTNLKLFYKDLGNMQEIYTQFFYGECLLFNNCNGDKEESFKIFDALLKDENLENEYKFIIKVYIQENIDDKMEKIDYLLKNFNFIEDRLEIFYELLLNIYENNINGIDHIYKEVQKYKNPRKPFSLFYIDDSIYSYKFQDILGSYLYKIEKYEEAAEITRNLLNQENNIPNKDLYRIKSNLLFYDSKISKEIVKSYNCQKPIVCFYIGYTNIFEGNTISKNIFGSELALLNLVNRMKEEYNVFVTCFNLNESYLIEGVKYISLNSLRNFESIYGKKIDILVISRYINYFIEVSHNAEITILWLHDMCLQASFQGKYLTDIGKYLFKNVYEKIDKIVCLSEWHGSNIQKLYEIDGVKINLIGNGINIDKFNYTNITKIRGKFIWISEFSRGGKQLVENFWRIKEILPEAELHIFRDINDDDMKRIIEEKYPHIKLRGKVSNEEILKELLTTEYWLYTTNFYETYCISALEAQLSACICICSNLGALSTTVGDRGILLKKEIYSEEYWKEVIESIKFFESDINNKLNTISKGINWARNQTWDNIWIEWRKMMKELLESKIKILK